MKISDYVQTLTLEVYLPQLNSTTTRVCVCKVQNQSLYFHTKYHQLNSRFEHILSNLNLNKLSI